MELPTLPNPKLTERDDDDDQVGRAINKSRFSLMLFSSAARRHEEHGKAEKKTWMNAKNQQNQTMSSSEVKKYLEEKKQSQEEIQSTVTLERAYSIGSRSM